MGRAVSDPPMMGTRALAGVNWSVVRSANELAPGVRGRAQGDLCRVCLEGARHVNTVSGRGGHRLRSLLVDRLEATRPRYITETVQTHHIGALSFTGAVFAADLAEAPPPVAGEPFTWLPDGSRGPRNNGSLWSKRGGISVGVVGKPGPSKLDGSRLGRKIRRHPTRRQYDPRGHRFATRFGRWFAD